MTLIISLGSHSMFLYYILDYMRTPYPDMSTLSLLLSFRYPISLSAKKYHFLIQIIYPLISKPMLKIKWVFHVIMMLKYAQGSICSKAIIIDKTGNSSRLWNYVRSACRCRSQHLPTWTFTCYTSWALFLRCPTSGLWEVLRLY